MRKHTPTEVESFVQDWVIEHLKIRSVSADLPVTVDDLAARLTGDARIHGISGGDMHRALGDIDTYLAERYLQATPL